MSKPDTLFKSIFSFTFAVIAIHLLIISVVVPSKLITFVSGIDSVAAILLGLKTDGNLGHAGIIIGIFDLILVVALLLYWS